MRSVLIALVALAMLSAFVRGHQHDLQLQPTGPLPPTEIP